MNRLARDATAWGKAVVTNYAMGMKLAGHTVVTASGEVATIVASWVLALRL